MRLRTFLDVHPTMLWLQFPDDEERWYPVAAAVGRIPPAHLSADALVTKTPGLDVGSLWIDELGTGYRWALEHDGPNPFRPHPWPWPPLEQRAS